MVAQSTPLQLLQIGQIVFKYFPQTSRKQIMAAEGDGGAINSNKEFLWVSKRSEETQFMFVRM